MMKPSEFIICTKITFLARNFYLDLGNRKGLTPAKKLRN